MKKLCQLKLTVRPELLTNLRYEAEKNQRSANAEAVKRLIASFVGKPRIRVPMGRLT